MTVLSLYTEHFRRISLRQLLVIFLLLQAPFVFAQAPAKKIVHDSASVKMREPDQRTQDEIFKDDYWRYDRDKSGKDEPNIFDRLWNSFIESLFDQTTSSGGKGGSFNFWNIFWIIVLVALVIFVVMKVTRSGTSSLFAGKKKKAETVDATLEEVDIHRIDFVQMLSDAVRRRDYRLAVRLWFLRTLKGLSDKEMLHWKIDKTNSDYYYDLTGSSLQKDFGDVSFIYDYIWYGENPVDETAYAIAEEKFRSLYSKIETL